MDEDETVRLGRPEGGAVGLEDEGWMSKVRK